MIDLMLALALIGAPDTPRPLGVETTIPFAGNGGLSDWQAGPPNSNVFFVHDRRENWYAVTLSGPCAQDDTSETITYTTDDLGTFDRFAHVSSTRNPTKVCSVMSIRTSAPPPGRLSRPKR